MAGVAVPLCIIRLSFVERSQQAEDLVKQNCLWGAFVFETANKRKSGIEFRCGFLFEEPGGLGGGPVTSVRPSSGSPKPG